MLSQRNSVNTLAIYTFFYILCVLFHFFGLPSDNFPREFHVSNQCVFLLPPPEVCVCVYVLNIERFSVHFTYYGLTGLYYLIYIWRDHDCTKEENTAPNLQGMLSLRSPNSYL